jgi:hypothetical protein
MSHNSNSLLFVRAKSELQPSFIWTASFSRLFTTLECMNTVGRANEVATSTSE